MWLQPRRVHSRGTVPMAAFWTVVKLTVKATGRLKSVDPTGMRFWSMGTPKGRHLVKNTKRMSSLGKEACKATRDVSPRRSPSTALDLVQRRETVK